jgi:TonB family protein
MGGGRLLPIFRVGHMIRQRWPDASPGKLYAVRSVEPRGLNMRRHLTTALLLGFLCAPHTGSAAPRAARPSLECREGKLSLRPEKVSGEYVKPRLVHRVDPVWPTDRSLRGMVAVEFLIDPSGRVCTVRALNPGSASDPWVRAAVAAVRQWRYRPATRKGKAIPVYSALTWNIDFQ